MIEAKNEKFIVRVIRKSETEPYEKDGQKFPKREVVDQIYEQEFDQMDIGKFATDLNRKDGKEKDDKSLKMGEDRDGIPALKNEK